MGPSQVEQFFMKNNVKTLIINTQEPGFCQLFDHIHFKRGNHHISKLDSEDSLNLKFLINLRTGLFATHA